MLNRIRISHIALIDELDIEFDAGFSVLTGETGAGKSILIEAVGFVLGERANRGSIQTGADKGSVEAVFTIAEQGPAAEFLKERELYYDTEVTLYRELSVSGRNSCRINGTLVSAAELKSLGDLLCDMHGQHAHQSLLNSKTHIGILDGFANSAEGGLKDRLEAARQTALKAGSKRRELSRSLRERERRLESIAYQLSEIEKANLRAGEEEELSAQKRRMQNARQISDGLNAAYEAVYGDAGAINSTAEARRAMGPLSDYAEEYKEVGERIDEAYYLLEDVSLTLRDLSLSFRFDPEELENAESRLALIYGLKRKYGASIEEILAYAEELANEREQLLLGEANIEQLEKEERAALALFKELAAELSSRRKAAAKVLCEAVPKELSGMGMNDVSFSVRFNELAAEELNENGIDEVEFYLSANRGEPEKPLARVASGGEISRIMLAFKVVLSSSDHIETLIFDEIDTGISGLIANAVADKMEQLSRSHQLLCVTHLPQIASAAAHHFSVYKEIVNDRTVSSVRLLSKEERIVEIARIMGSDACDKAAIEHAQRMIERR